VLSGVHMHQAKHGVSVHSSKLHIPKANHSLEFMHLQGINSP
jgi:hypothetical protein